MMTTAREFTMLGLALFPTLAACTVAASETPRTYGTDAGVPISASSDGGISVSSGANLPTGIVVIDVQRSFISTASRRNPSSDVPRRVANNKYLFDLASAKQVPFFITYEASKTGEASLPDVLASDVPAGAKEFIKTTFAATGQPYFADAIRTSGLRRLVVVGAETDVCVLQTILGLRRAGYVVVAALDAIFTEEVNAGPAIRRMRQAGVETVQTSEVESVLAGTRPIAESPAAAQPPIVRPMEMGFLLHALDQMGSDANAAAKRARLKELLMISEWFRIPLFAVDPLRAAAALPADLRGIITHGIQPLANKPASVTQLALAGGHAGVRETAASLRAQGPLGGVEVFLLEDTLIGGTATDLEPAYADGAVPSTYKTLYYELTRSVNDAEWPSRQWVTDANRYYDLTSAPEDLPPIAGGS
jgi:nicotinamidase-related amidase